LLILLAPFQIASRGYWTKAADSADSMPIPDE
jgi:hypothetical protein